MPTVTLTRDEAGKLIGLTDPDKRAYQKFRERLDGLSISDCISFTWRDPRSGQHHRFFFVALGHIFDQQEQFDRPDDFRLWAEVGAGHCRFVPGPNGRMVALPKSINYSTLDEVQFGLVKESIFMFLRSERACAFLWPDVKPIEALAMVDRALES